MSEIIPQIYVSDFYMGGGGGRNRLVYVHSFNFKPNRMTPIRITHKFIVRISTQIIKIDISKTWLFIPTSKLIMNNLN